MLPRHKVPAIRARCFSSGAKPITERRSRFVPTMAAAAAIGVGIYYYKRKNPTRLDHRPEPACRSCEKEYDWGNEVCFEHQPQESVRR
ncbi:hypothetical protein IMZ48_49015 [Candidatus Bathyarchaeota archaeon]|nr:hypothetical protein [Candidatus Bathyarchaeota archaeon]